MFSVSTAFVAQASDDLGPVSVVASRDGAVLFIANADARQIAVVSTADRKVIASIGMYAEPTALALSADGRRLYIACAAPKSIICIVDTASRKRVGGILAGHTAAGLAVSPDGKRLFVCNRFDNDVSVIDLALGKEIGRVPVAREPVAAVATPDGRSVFVVNQLPTDRADTGEVAAVVSVIDATADRVSTTIRLPNGSSSALGACISPDGKRLYVTHILSRYQMPTTQLERGWMNTNAMSIIDVETKKLLGTVLLDDVDRGAANPWGVAATADGRWIAVAQAGTNELSVIDAPAMLDRLAKAPVASDVANDLAFLVGLRRRVKLPGVGPRGVCVAGQTAYAAEYYSDTLGVVNLASDAVGEIALGPKPTLSVARRGQMLFESADLCFQQWQSCTSCHPDARADGLNWDLMNDGIGNPKNTRSMLLAHENGPVMSLGVRKNAETAVRAGITHIQFAVRPEEDARAIDEYLKSLRPTPSPRLVDGRLSAAAERGKIVFFDPKIGCARCHPEPNYSDKLLHDVGSAGPTDRPTDKFLTPVLVEVWRTAPYLHDGRYPTVKELIVRGRHGLKDDVLGGLSERQIDDLVEFVLSL